MNLLKIKIRIKGTNKETRVDVELDDSVKHAVAGAAVDFPEIGDTLANVIQIEDPQGIGYVFSDLLTEEKTLILTLGGK